MNNTISIELDKIKILWLAVIAVVFAWIGYIEYNDPSYNVPQFIFDFIIVAFLFTAILLFIKLLDNSPGIIISSKGICNNVTIFDNVFISWEDVIDIKIDTKYYKNYIILNVKEIYRCDNKPNNSILKRIMFAFYKKRFGSIPHYINPCTLKIDEEELYNILQNYYQLSK